MRKIRFRGQTVDTKELIYGDLIHRPTVNDICIANQNLTRSVSPDTVGQFTGFTDKNGVEIFESDLLIDRYPVDEEDLSLGYNESFLPVVWCDKQLMWCVDASFAKDGSYLYSLVEYFDEFLEVKGNIYENPEILKADCSGCL